MASLLAIFPALLVTACSFVPHGRGSERSSPSPLPSPQGERENSVLVSFAVTGALLFVATLVRPHGFDDWREFYANLSRHMQGAAYNTVGFASILDRERIALADSPLPPETFRPGSPARSVSRPPSQWPCSSSVSGAGGRMRSRRSRSGACRPSRPSSSPRIITWCSCSWCRRIGNRPRRSGCSSGSSSRLTRCFLFEESETVLFLYRNILIGLLLLALNVETVAEIGRTLVARPAETAA